MRLGRLSPEVKAEIQRDAARQAECLNRAEAAVRGGTVQDFNSAVQDLFALWDEPYADANELRAALA